jgi:hypothetical protein
VFQAFLEVARQERTKASETFVLGAVDALVGDQMPVAPKFPADKNAIPQAHSGCGKKRQAQFSGHPPQKRLARQWDVADPKKADLAGTADPHGQGVGLALTRERVAFAQDAFFRGLGPAHDERHRQGKEPGKRGHPASVKQLSEARKKNPGKRVENSFWTNPRAGC